MKYSFGTASRRNREGVDRRLIEISDMAISITAVDFGHGPDSGLRTVERQQELWRAGKSRANGTTNRSRHQDGKALDFYAFVNGKASWEPHHLAMVAAAHLQAASMLGYRVSWGGLWVRDGAVPVNGVRYGWDMPHIELLED